MYCGYSIIDDGLCPLLPRFDCRLVIVSFTTTSSALGARNVVMPIEVSTIPRHFHLREITAERTGREHDDVWPVACAGDGECAKVAVIGHQPLPSLGTVGRI